MRGKCDPFGVWSGITRSLRGLFLAGAALVTAPAVLALSYSDGTFATADWTQVDVVQTGIATATYLRDTSGGNPGALTLVQYVVPRSTFSYQNDTRVADIATAFAYDPAVQGALGTMDFALDMRGIGNFFTFTSLGSVRPALLQGGKVYTVAGADVAPVLGVDWASANWSFDAGDDWRSAAAVIERPDFSASGAPIQFGFRWNIATFCTDPAGCRGGSLAVGFDNFSVTALAAAAPVPEPGQWALLLSGLGLLAGVVRRRY